ncbi:jerky homolog-like isoform X1, partial [Brachionus plicatilis]
ALHIIRDSWKKVTSTTINNCWKRCSIMPTTNAQTPSIKDEHLKVVESLYELLKKLKSGFYNYRMTTDELIDVDAHESTGEALTDQDIIEIIQKNDENCDDEVELIDQEPVSVSYKQAKQAIDQVQFFFETSKDFNECDLELLSKIKERMSDLRLSSLNQTFISSFFKKN